MEPGLATEDADELSECIQRALAEDIRSGDVTTNSIVASGATLHGRIIAKQPGVIAGLDIAKRVFVSLNPDIRFLSQVDEGAVVDKGQVVARVHGSARALLTGERTALNFLGRMSGIATLTRRFVERIAGTSAIMLDTRKTAPGLRVIDKLAVQHGGGQNHRAGLFDMVLIKDNHIDFAGSITSAVESVKACGTNLEIEVEARTLDDVREAIELGIKRILLDNMSIAMMKEAVEINGGKARLEASGNITLDNVREVAQTGVDFISVGALTHSAPVFDISLKWEPENRSG